MKNSSGRLYRIVNFQHAVQLFEQKELHFASPSAWEDPYEMRLVHESISRTYAQCWCSKGVSDAMWRIYSQNHLGIRISTSTKKLREAIEAEAKIRNFDFRLGDVEYLTQLQIAQRTKDIHKNLNSSFSLDKAIDLLFLKREAFDHEAEYRAAVMLNHPAAEASPKAIKIKINPHKFIDNILIDPRAPDELADALCFYFKNKIGYKKRVSRSVLYKAPSPLIFE